jgi:hypothetical protein
MIQATSTLTRAGPTIALARFIISLLPCWPPYHELQLWRHYEQLPEQERPARFTGEPF